MSDSIGRPVIVTGADGFIGSHLVEHLARRGCSIRALCLYNSNGSFGWLDDLAPELEGRVERVLGDIRDEGFVADLVQPGSLVFHLAALIAIPYSYVAPGSFVDTNIRGTFNILEATRRTDDVTLISTSTSEVYGTPEVTPISEAHPIQPQSPYAATKAAADNLCAAYAATYALDIRTVRPFNTYGPRQSLRGVIPTILAQLLAGLDEIHLGSLHPRRDFTFVADTVEGILRMAEADVEPGTVIHLGTGQSVSIGDLVDVCQAVVGRQATVVADDARVRPPASEVQVLVSDPSRARQMLGWEARTSLMEGMTLTAEWLAPRVDALSATRYHR